MKSPTGAQPRTVRRFGDDALGTALLTGDHVLAVPLDHADPTRGTLELYAREVRAVATADDDLPYLVFFQGGPGGRSPRPLADSAGWLTWATERYRVILLDQRGTGRSTPQDRYTLAGRTAADAAEYLSHFRATDIVEDAEALRTHLLGDTPWTSLGQSFGGFCTWTYLSHHPQGLAAAYVTGGIPPVGRHPDEVYRATHRALDRRVGDLDAAHPDVRARLADVARHLEHTAEYLPTGERLTTARLQGLGVVLGSGTGIDVLAHLTDDAWSVPGRHLSDAFLAGVARVIGYADRPLYALVHEACYADPAPGAAVVTDWSAQRVRAEVGLAEEPVTDPGDGVARLPLYSEMVYPHTVALDPSLAPLAEVAQALAELPWTQPLYDPARLAENTVPVAACVYTQDLYVDTEISLDVAARTGAVRVVEDAVHHHDGLRAAGPEILTGLQAALEGGAS